MAKTVGLGVKKTSKSRTRKGKRFVGDILGLLNPTIGTVAKTVGLGVKARKPRAQKTRAKKGKGVVSDIAKSGVKALAPMLIDHVGHVTGGGDVVKRRSNARHVSQDLNPGRPLFMFLAAGASVCTACGPGSYSASPGAST